MDSEGKNLKPNSKGVFRRKGAWGNLFSCFNGGLGLSDQETKKSYNWGKRQIVVPVESSGEIEIDTDGDAIGMKDRNQGMNPSQKSSKDKSKTTTSNTKNQQLLPSQELSVGHPASKLKTRIEPAPLDKMLDPVHSRTKNSTTYHSSPERSPRVESAHDSSMGLGILTAALAFVIFCGSTFAVIFMCLWFYIMYMLRNDDVVVPNVIKGLEKIDVNSEEHKRMVVHRRFLDRERAFRRDRRKPLADWVRESEF